MSLRVFLPCPPTSTISSIERHMELSRSAYNSLLVSSHTSEHQLPRAVSPCSMPETLWPCLEGCSHSVHPPAHYQQQREARQGLSPCFWHSGLLQQRSGCQPLRTDWCMLRSVEGCAHPAHPTRHTISSCAGCVRDCHLIFGIHPVRI